MKTTEVNNDIIGKRCKTNFKGKMVAGTIKDIIIDQPTYTQVLVEFDEPHRWRDSMYKHEWLIGSDTDEFGTLTHLEIIDNKYKAIKVEFHTYIAEIDRMFTVDYENWQVVNFKEWIDNYGGDSRCTQIDNFTAIITSEDNITFIEEWLRKNTDIKSIKTL